MNLIFKNKKILNLSKEEYNRNIKLFMINMIQIKYSAKKKKKIV